MGAGGASVVHGGAGDDDLVGSAANDQLFGDDGDDELAGHEGNDTLDGGAGIDLLATEPGRHYDDDPGADDYRGGPGGDTLFYNDHAAGTTISRNEMADDGTGGEGDNVHDDIETIYGTAFADTFRGGAGDDQVYGGDGNDTLDGAGGSDTLNGDAGNDTIAGGPGSDRLTGDSGDDMINGGAGTDTLNGDRAGCTPPSCIGGNDILFARDGGRDGVSCGPATDSAQLDAGDSIGGDGGAEACESVDRSAPPPAYVVTPAPFKQHFTMTTSGKLTVSKGVGVTVTCPGIVRVHSVASDQRRDRATLRARSQGPDAPACDGVADERGQQDDPSDPVVANAAQAASRANRPGRPDGPGARRTRQAGDEEARGHAAQVARRSARPALLVAHDEIGPDREQHDADDLRGADRLRARRASRSGRRRRRSPAGRRSSPRSRRRRRASGR